MMWLAVERAVHLCTLVLLIVMLSIIFNNNKSSEDFDEFERQLSLYKVENQTTRNNNIAYIEKRINKLQEYQDNYQILVDRRLLIMEAQIKQLTDANKVAQRVVNTNINTVGNITSK